MTKIMVVVLAVLFSGCAHTVPSAERAEEVNPHASKNSELLEGVGGGILFNYIARMTGAGQTFSYFAGATGVVAGVNDARRREWRPGDDEIIYLDQPAGDQTTYGYSGNCNVSVACNQRRVPAGLYGYCDDEGSGGYATYESVLRGAQQRAGCYSSVQASYSQQHHASFVQQQPVIVQYPANMWERSDRKQKAGNAPKYEGPTVGDYMSPKWAQVIPEKCKKGNFGHDSNCLFKEAEILDKKQQECEVDGSKCNPSLNFGKMAKIDRKLASDLRREQDN